MNAPDTGSGSCTASYPQRITKAQCCCSIGAGWGQNPGYCDACPLKGTKAFEELCPGWSSQSIGNDDHAATYNQVAC